MCNTNDPTLSFSQLLVPKVFIKIVQFYSTDLHYHLYYNLYSHVYLSLFICFLFCFFIGLSVFYGLPGWLNVKESTCNAGDIETQVQSLGWENPLEKEMATHSSILAWKIPRAEEPSRLQPMGLQRVGHDWVHTHTEWWENGGFRHRRLVLSATHLLWALISLFLFV